MSEMATVFFAEKRPLTNRALLDLNRRIRLAMPAMPDTMRLDRVSMSEVKEGYLDGEPIQRVIMILRGMGCAWSLARGGGCFMCGHLCGTTRGLPISANDFISQFDREMASYDFSAHPMLCVYNSGSFLNGQEVPAEARRHIYRRIRETPGIRKLTIESRPEFITEEALLEIEEHVGSSITVEIGVGLETASESVNSFCVNKGYGWREFGELASRMKPFRTRLLAYVLLKPPFLTEVEAIEDSCQAIDFAFNSGSDAVSLEPVSVQDFTLTGFLSEAGLYRPPWIWSVIEVARRTRHLGLVRLGGFEFFPIPKEFTHNCSLCNESAMRAIQTYNRTFDIGVFDDLACSCRREWKRELLLSEEALADRVSRMLQSISHEEVLDRMRSKHEAYDPSTSDTHHQLLHRSRLAHRV
jgi:radical SAM enzyme (TIGR01210 family)